MKLIDDKLMPRFAIKIEYKLQSVPGKKKTAKVDNALNYY